VSAPLPMQTAEAAVADARVIRSTRRRPRRTVARVATNLLGVVVIVVMAFPVYWMVISAFKPGKDLLTYTPQFFPTSPTLANFLM